LTWATLDPSAIAVTSKTLNSEAIAASQDIDDLSGEKNSRDSKRRRKRLEKVVNKAAEHNKIANLAENTQGGIQVVVVVSDDKVACFLPSVATVIKKLSVPKSSTTTTTPTDDKVTSVARRWNYN
jgi:hypothetical protein